MKLKEIQGNVYDIHLEVATHNVEFVWRLIKELREKTERVQDEYPGELQINFLTLSRNGQYYPKSRQEFESQ